MVKSNQMVQIDIDLVALERNHNAATRFAEVVVRVQILLRLILQVNAGRKVLRILDGEQFLGHLHPVQGDVIVTTAIILHG